MFQKVLIANRGEIAVRIIRACRELGIATVAVFSEPDREALHTQLADEAVCIGPARSRDSYLHMANILGAAVAKQVQAIHPGFGFLAENSTFAAMCQECNITFIGPSSELIDQMGDKANARALMQKAGIPVIPGSSHTLLDAAAAKEEADAIGYPVMIKATAGGGGRGIRLVREPEAFCAAFDSAREEALTAFGNGTMYLEKVIEHARHIEVQILGDRFGNAIHLGERDCSLQRRNQKVIEEAPAAMLPAALRAEMGETAVRAARAVGYENAGTIEFLYDREGHYYFMEMNTRLQVEHPVTEMVTGVDIVKEQIKIAAGKPLSLKQEDVCLLGHAIECRVNAEDPKRGFAPSPGQIDFLLLPGGHNTRIDSAIYAGCTIPPSYDSMLAKVIVHGKTREEAIAKMRRCLHEFVLEGVATNLSFLEAILTHPQYKSGVFDTTFLTETVFLEEE